MAEIASQAYMPLADDLQNILIRQLMSIRPFNEGDMGSLFDEIERIRELCIKAGSDEEPMSERWPKAAILQNLPDKVVQTLAIELKRATSVEDMYSIINTYMFDHRTGLPRGQTSPMLYLTECPTPENTDEIVNLNGDKESTAEQQEDNQTTQKTNKEEDSEKELYVTSADEGKGT